MVYDITAVPAEIPLTTPLDGPTIATPVLLLLHVPPDDPSVSVIFDPAHTIAVAPPIAVGGFMVLTDAVPGLGQEFVPFTVRLTLYVPATGP